MGAPPLLLNIKKHRRNKEVRRNQIATLKRCPRTSSWSCHKHSLVYNISGAFAVVENNSLGKVSLGNFPLNLTPLFSSRKGRCDYSLALLYVNEKMLWAKLENSCCEGGASWVHVLLVFIGCALYTGSCLENCTHPDPTCLKFPSKICLECILVQWWRRCLACLCSALECLDLSYSASNSSFSLALPLGVHKWWVKYLGPHNHTGDLRILDWITPPPAHVLWHLGMKQWMADLCLSHCAFKMNKQIFLENESSALVYSRTVCKSFNIHGMQFVLL